MNVVVGTKNKTKISIVATVFDELFPAAAHTITGEDITSGVPDTPRGEQTKRGAFTRASTAAKTTTNTYGVGIESGLVERYGVWFEEAWACVVVNGVPYYGYSSGLPIPRYVLSKMKESSLEHGPAMRQILADLNRPDERDTWGTYSDKLILRDVSLQEALRNALIQTIASDNSLYHM